MTGSRIILIIVSLFLVVSIVILAAAESALLLMISGAALFLFTGKKPDRVLLPLPVIQLHTLSPRSPPLT